MKTQFKTLGRIALAIAGVLVLFILIVGSGNYIQSLGFQQLSNIIMLLFPIAVYFYVRWLNRRLNYLNPSAYGFRFTNFARNVFQGFAFATAILAVALLAIHLCLDVAVTFIPLEADFLKPLLVLLATLIIVGAWEEFFFRGFVLTTLIHYKFGFHGAALISSVTFSIVHWLSFDMSETSWLWYIGIVILGYLLALLYVLTKSIWSVAAFHLIWNFWAHLFDERGNAVGIITIRNYAEYSKEIGAITVLTLAVVLIGVLVIKRCTIKSLYPARTLYTFPDSFE